MGDSMPEIDIADVVGVDAAKDGQTIWLRCKTANGGPFAVKLRYGSLGQLTAIIAQGAKMAHKNQVTVTPDPTAIGASVGAIWPAHSAQVASSPDLSGLLFQFLSSDRIPASYQVSIEIARKFLGDLQTALKSISVGAKVEGPKTH